MWASPFGNNLLSDNLKGDYHATWQLYKKAEGVFVAIEFQN